MDYNRTNDIGITDPEHFAKPMELADFIVGLIQEGSYTFGRDDLLSALRVAFSVADLGLVIEEKASEQ